MYLKRLELKGFKSFAKRTVLNMEPGVSAIVGPNGSGKSNICDAILWVLGERKAKNLRGGIMEDVIFAGSSACDAVSVAEVTLVLDNSDNTLPVDYSEVSISRRMFRSGESDYLINGIIARRLDVLDILHDSGMGSDTNSIISQGNLESVLNSLPVERRSLIEEAAGILKHKQRMFRSNNKLERMNQNLERIGDVMAEIERQLKPLRIKAKRAAAYDSIMEELNGLNLELAVDDLKQIHAQWQEKNKLKDKLETEVNHTREVMDKAQKAVRELQNKISSQSTKIVEQANCQRRLSNYVEKLDASILVLREKEKNAKQLYQQLSGKNQDESDDKAKQSIELEISALQNQIKIISQKNDLAIQNVEACTKNKLEAQQKLKELEEVYNQLLGKQKTLSSSREDFQKKLKVVEDDVLKAQSKIQALNNVISDYEARSKEAVKNVESANNYLNELNNKFLESSRCIDRLETLSEESKQNVAKAKDKVLDTESKISSYKSELNALSRLIDKLKDEENSSHKWVEANKYSINAAIGNIADDITIDDEYVTVVEAILGSYAQGFSTTKASNLSEIFKALKNSDSDGCVKFVVYGDLYNSNTTKFAKKHSAVVLSDKVRISDTKNSGLFENVVVFDDAKDAMLAYEPGITCASKDGTVLWADGRASINIRSSISNSNEKSGSIISYKKQIRDLNAKLEKANKTSAKEKTILEKAIKENDEITEELFDQKSKYAQLRGEVEAAKKNKDSLEKSAENIQDNLKSSKHDIQLLKEAYSANAPEIEKYKKSIEDLSTQIEDTKVQSNKIFDKLDIQRVAVDDLAKAENDAKFDAMKIAQDLTVKRDQLHLSNEKIIEIEQRAKQNYAQMHKSEAIYSRCLALINVLKCISDDARDTLSAVDDSSDKIDIEAKRIQAQNRQAAEDLEQAQKQHEEIRCKLNDVEIELGGIKVRVQSAVDVINNIDGISVDSALCMDDIVDRPAKEERSFRLKRRIENMGPINPDAQREYQEMYDRFKFLQSQIDDINSARLNLRKINKIIEHRMKDDFIDTFTVVNNNFQDIFGTLFPGGHAQLELDDPQNPETSGVEVKAQPKGKRISKMSLMSGGEKSLVALCLLFAVYKTRATPFYILDEVEAALDDTNLRRLIHYLNQLRGTTQLLMITHQRRTMEMADTLFGVSMRSDGVTKVVTQKLDSALRYANSVK